MNANPTVDDVTIAYYDSDYPSEHFSPYPENFDATTVYQGIRHDVGRNLDLARESGGDVLELCCGTGRVAIPLARDGHQVTAVDLSPGMLDAFRKNLENESPDTRDNLQLTEQDITHLSLPKSDYSLIVIAFNSLACIPDAADQLNALVATGRHLAKGGRLVLDIVNPLSLGIAGETTPTPFFTRRSVATGNQYTRFAMRSPFDENNRQKLFGWYDEEHDDGVIKRKHYAMHWRPIFKPEIELMMTCAGLRIESIEGGHQREAFTAESPRMFITARRAGANGDHHRNGWPSTIRTCGDFI